MENKKSKFFILPLVLFIICCAFHIFSIVVEFSYDIRWISGILTLIFFLFLIVTILTTVLFQKEGKYSIGKENSTFTNKDNYAESRFGAIEVFEDYMIIYVNYVPFVSARRKRTQARIYYKDLIYASFMPAGWFRGYIKLWSKSCIRQKEDTRIPFRLWLPSSSRKNSLEFKKIYDYIVFKIDSNKKHIAENGNINVNY